MDDELRRKLQDCLREVESTGDIEAALRRFPRDAEVLRPYLELATSLGSQLGAPAEADRLAGRQRLLSEIANLDRRERGIGHMTIFGQKLLPVAGAVLGAVFLLGGMAGAAALPGSPVPAPQDALPFVHHSSVQTASDSEDENCNSAEANDDDANSEPSEGDCVTPTPTPAATPTASPEDQNDDGQNNEGDTEGQDGEHSTASPAPDDQHEGDNNEGIQPGATPGSGDDHESATATPSATQQPEGDSHSGDSSN